MKKEIGIFMASAALVLEGCSNITLPKQTPKPEVPSQTPSELVTPMPSLAEPTTSASQVALPIDIIDCQKDPLDGATGSFPVDKGKYVRVGGITKTGAEELVDVIVDDKGVVTFRPETSELKGSLSKVDGSAVFQDKNLFINLVPIFNKNELNFNITIVCADRLPYLSPSPDLPQG